MYKDKKQTASEWAEEHDIPNPLTAEHFNQIRKKFAGQNPFYDLNEIIDYNQADVWASNLAIAFELSEIKEVLKDISKRLNNIS